MSASDEWTDWHLTAKGWERGSEKVDVQGVTNREPPPTRVLSCRYHEFQSSAFSKMKVWHDATWMDPDSDLVARMILKHGPCPRKL